MKKFLLFTLWSLFISLQSQAQLDSIPNSSFENWQYLPNATVRPTGWLDNDNSIAAWNVMPDSMANTGFLSAKIEYASYRGILYSGFPVADHPLALNGFMKNYLNLGDTAIISIHVYSSAVLVDSGYMEIYGGIATAFLPFTVSITQNASVADSCVITLTGGNMFGSISWFDDLSFSFPTAVEEESSGTALTVFPNPVSDELIVESSGFRGESELIIYSVLGKKVLVSPISNLKPQIPINVSQLSSGIYLLSIAGSKKRAQTVFVKQ
jgi:hypothetical protein